MTKPTRDYAEALLARLVADDYAIAYLNTVLAPGGEDASGEFLAALRLVAKAKKVSMTALSQDAELGRQALYRALHKQGNPELATLTRVLACRDLRLAVAEAA